MSFTRDDAPSMRGLPAAEKGCELKTLAKQIVKLDSLMKSSAQPYSLHMSDFVDGSWIDNALKRYCPGFDQYQVFWRKMRKREKC